MNNMNSENLCLSESAKLTINKDAQGSKHQNIFTLSL